MDKNNLAPLWEVLHNLIPNEPSTPCKPALWNTGRAALPDGGRQADHRQGGDPPRADPGEPGDARRVVHHAEPLCRAAAHPARRDRPSHRHSQSALRFIVEGSGATPRSTASAPRCSRATSSSRRRGPGTTTATRATSRWCGWTASTSASCRPSPRSSTRCTRRKCSRSRAAKARRSRASGRAWPLGAPAPFGKTSPIFNYPTAQPRLAGEDCARDDTCHGWKMEFINPLTGGHAMPTIAAFIQLLPKGSDPTLPLHRRHGVLGGRGTGSALIGGERFDFEPRDTFVVPSWYPLVLETHGETVLFSFSDRPGQEAMGLWREKRG